MNYAKRFAKGKIVIQRSEMHSSDYFYDLTVSMHRWIRQFTIENFPVTQQTLYKYSIAEFCSTLVWVLNSSSILQELTLTTIAIFAALTVRDEGPTIKKHHLKYHLASLTVISACIGVTGVLNFEPDGCVFLAQDISPKYGLFYNGLRSVLMVATILRWAIKFYCVLVGIREKIIWGSFNT